MTTFTEDERGGSTRTYKSFIQRAVLVYRANSGLELTSDCWSKSALKYYKAKMNYELSTTTMTSTSDPISIDSDRDSTKSDSESDVLPTKEQDMYIWSAKFEKWHECSVSFYPPSLQIVEYEDQKMEVNENQLKHLTKSWFHGALSRREARVILQDFGGGNGSFLVRASESYHGKFAVSFVHNSSVKHVVIESRRDPVTGVLYNITPNGPSFSSLYELIVEAQTRPLIHNHSFNIQLTCSPPKPDMSWLHKGVKSLSQAEQILRKEHRDGAFFVYKTKSQYSPYIVAYRSNGSILHNLVVYSQRPTSGYTLNHVTSQVLYKVIHYFMENPINDKTVLTYPVPDRNSVVTNCGIALRDWLGDREMNELCFNYGALVTNIKDKTEEWSLGDHRGDKQKYFKRSHIRLLTKDELTFVNELRRLHGKSSVSDCDESTVEHNHTVELCLQNTYEVDFLQKDDDGSAMLVIQPSNPSIDRYPVYKLSCPSPEDLESWYHSLNKANCLPKSQHRTLSSTKSKLSSRCILS